MNQRLEQYLGEAERKLQGLPEARRKEELEEMRQHLTASVEAHEELGLDTTSATEESIRQFGTARQVGRELKQVWWREQIGGPRGLWKTAALVIALHYGLQGLMTPFATLISLIGGAAIHSPSSQLDMAPVIIAAMAVLTALPSGASGVIVGKLSPRNAVLASMMGSTICLTIALLNISIGSSLVTSTARHNGAVCQNFGIEVLKMILIIAGAKLSVLQTRKQLKKYKA